MEIRRKPEDPWQKPGIIDKLKSMRASGISASIIAKALNDEFATSFSRNAIIGKASRLGLATPGTNDGTLRRSPKFKPIIISKPKKERIMEPEPESLRIPLRDTKSGQCRYIASGERGANEVCGHDTESPEKVWCPYHATRVFSPQQSHKHAADGIR